MMKYLQKLGKALMLPVAVLPICGILMGHRLCPRSRLLWAFPSAATSGAAYTVGFLLVKAGGALIDNMAWLFAIGAAVGLADNDGTAGLAGLVSFLMMQQLLNPGCGQRWCATSGRGYRYLHRIPEGRRQLLYRHSGRRYRRCLLQQVQEYPAA